MAIFLAPNLWSFYNLFFRYRQYHDTKWEKKPIDKKNIEFQTDLMELEDKKSPSILFRCEMLRIIISTHIRIKVDAKLFDRCVTRGPFFRFEQNMNEANDIEWKTTKEETKKKKLVAKIEGNQWNEFLIKSPLKLCDCFQCAL